MLADIPGASAPRDSLLATAGWWARRMSPPERSRLAAAGFVAMGLSLLLAPRAPLVLLGTGCLGAAALVLALRGVVANADERTPRPVLRRAERGLAAVLVGTIGVAAAAFLLAFLGKSWTL
jgi:hypothetical protein